MGDVAAYSITSALGKFGIRQDPKLDQGTRHIVNDSRQVQPGDIFAAVRGTLSQGHVYIEAAIAAGAQLILIDIDDESGHGQLRWLQGTSRSVAAIEFYQLGQSLAEIASAYYQYPANDMTVYGVTGTNGKTSVCQLIAQILNYADTPAAIIGTLGAGPLQNLRDIANTTPGPTLLQSLLADFKQLAIANVAMEVSSHALEQKRLQPDLVDVAIFTNLSRDHLDYHGTMQAYADAKGKLFVDNGRQRWVMNADDRQTLGYLGNANRDISTVLVSSRQSLASLQEQFVNLTHYVVASDIHCHPQGLSFSIVSSWGEAVIDTPLLGRFNVDNLLACFGALLISGISLQQLVLASQKLRAVAGRMEAFAGVNTTTAVVDYAHTPDALENALQACRYHNPRQLWVVFGCGGDRDKGKRPLMAKAAQQYADHLIITNDNPRSESPQAIADDIISGLEKPEQAKVILDRRQAVTFALSQAGPQDMVLLAGKGHEDYMIIGEQRIDYDERAVVADYFAGES
ncbi:UDP-N-acetylmuramoyl-L-alanyl-D-glutamate--2,6-diaminopimelate ligase [Thalassotalea mangrovi]|uniref:UDP-N-acetylmuramoyl-L-alanyl-D-glutamate--2,6-diaminopimelate ligase n=1 Tax=Thalassotalea mangrovi TaxID=2572245 RepID=A0A4U1BCB2_9GAMM|nr:UDP-N-acetylmuramoyl-L-alanyl-D-glutamate--2,6-diaminopimelate ligase [Thalassotalea mangrovi]TKB47671.1 UDP-N-acetylmuramoyl-L-alanyl-D-glutamate--2,6-diaminopimelate ligase [Thalassotalea mangrovi]